MTRAIILCAGEATRWKNNLNVPKHLIEIEGEKILHRTVRLLEERGVKDIHIIVKDHDMRYQCGKAVRHVIKPNYKENADADKFLSSKKWWNKTGRTIVLYGDCYFTEEAMNIITSYPVREWTLFCRPDASTITGSKWGECFAQSFYPEHLEEHEKQLHYIAELYKTGVINRCGGWEHYRAMTGRRGIKVRRPHRMTTNYVKIDSWDEDFDFPQDYIEWMKRRKIWRESQESNV